MNSKVGDNSFKPSNVYGSKVYENESKKYLTNNKDAIAEDFKGEFSTFNNESRVVKQSAEEKDEEEER